MSAIRGKSKHRTRPYRYKVVCSSCKKEMASEYQKQHSKTQHSGENVVFTPVIEPKQSTLQHCLQLTSNPRKSSSIEPECVPMTTALDLKVDEEASGSKVSNLCSPKSGDNFEKDCQLMEWESDCVSAVNKIPDDDDDDDEKDDNDDDKIDKPTLVNVAQTSASGSKVGLNLDLDMPKQPIQSSYAPRMFGKEKFTRDLDPMWFKKYPWLSYIDSTKEAHCHACDKYIKGNKFVFIHWKKPERLLKHSKSKTHFTAMTAWIRERSSCKSVSQLLDDDHMQFVQRNRQYLRVIIECLYFTASQNIAQRGHVETRQDLEDISDINRGNFLELIHLRSRDLPWLEEKLRSTHNKHKMWLAPMIQNELLDIMANLVLQTICTAVRESDSFGIIVDETSDISHTEQVSICVSFLNQVGEKKESFIGFYDTKTTDGETLYRLVKTVMFDLNLDPKKIVAECFDGAASMKGKVKGLATRMKEISPMSIYVHCHGHLLNLALQAAMSEVPCMRNALGTVQALYNFIEASPKRHAVFKDIDVTEDHHNLSLKSLSETRWSCRWSAVRAVIDQMERIVKLLIALSNDKDSKTAAGSKSLLIAICDFDFIFALHVLKIILSNVDALSKYLQKRNLDILTAKSCADMTIKTLKNCRTDENFRLLWDSVEQSTIKIKQWIIDVTEVEFKDARIPRTKTPSRRMVALLGEIAAPPNVTKSLHQHYRNIYNESMDTILRELDYRFATEDQDLLCALANIALETTPKQEAYLKISEFYGFDKDLLQIEKQHFETFLDDHGDIKRDIPTLLTLFIKEKLFEILPELWKLFKILATIPATSCSAERSFSALRRLKSYLRSMMGQSRLRNLAILSIEREFANCVMRSSIDEIINIFGKQHERECYFF